MGYELDRAKMEAGRNAASDAYFEARPQIDTGDRRRVFEAGFDRAWKKAPKAEIERLQAESASQLALIREVFNDDGADMLPSILKQRMAAEIDGFKTPNAK